VSPFATRAGQEGFESIQVRGRNPSIIVGRKKGAN
jgi:hypothetical protein